MITSNDDVMELKIDEPILSSSSSLLKSHHHHHESSGYSSKEAECSSPENKTHIQHRQHENRLKITPNPNNNNNNNTNNSNKTSDINRRRHKLATSSSSSTVSNSGSLTIDECLIEANNSEQTVITLDKSTHRLSPICDEQLITTTNTLSNNPHFPMIIPSDDNHISPPSSATTTTTTTTTTATTLSRHSTKSPSHQATLFARRHFHVYDWTRLSFYDNVPPPLDYQSEPSFIDNHSPTGTSISSTDETHPKRSSLAHIRTSTDRKDSGLGTSSVERQIDSIVLANNPDPLHRSTSSLSSCSSSSSSSSSSSQSDVTNTIPSSSTSSRLPTSRKIRVKWHSFTKSHRPSFNSSKYHLGQMSVGQLFALRRTASIRIQELFDTTRILSSNKDDKISSLTNSTATTSSQSLLASAFSAVPKLIIRRHQQRKEGHQEIKDVKKSVFGVSLLSMTQRTGHPVPITILSAMKYLRRTSIDSVGIFRKPGVSHRIKRLHDLIESDLEFHQFDDFSPYDVSDVLKQYFRSLPECLFTTKLSPLFLNISEHFSTLSSQTIDSTSIKLNNERRLRSLQYAVLLLPDENRLVLHLLLSFLNDVSKHSKTNQMSSINLATCFAPTLFSFRNYHNSVDMNDLPSTIRKNQQTIISPNIMGMPDWREIQEQRKAMEILAFMIDNARLLFLVPDELHQACHFSYIEIGEPCTLEELSRRVSEASANTTVTTTTTPTLNKYRRCSSSNIVGKRTAQQRATEIGTISASDSIGSLSSSPSASSSCENMLLNDNLHSKQQNQTSLTTMKSYSSSHSFNDDTHPSLHSLSSSIITTNNNNDSHNSTNYNNNNRNCSYQNFIDRCIVEVMRESCSNKLKGWTSFGISNDLELAFKKLDDGHPLGLWKSSVEIEAPPIEILNRLLNERQSWDDDFQSGSILEQLNPHTHVYQYTLNSMAPLASRYFCEVRSWRTNLQLNTNGSYQSTNTNTNNNSVALPVGSSSSASSSAIASFITTQHPNNQKRDACVLVCTSIEHPKAHCPPALVRAVTLASRYLIQSNGCGKSKVTHLSRVDLMGRSNEWYTKAYGSILTRSMTKLRDSFAHLNTGPETKV